MSRFLIRSLGGQMAWLNVLQVLKERNRQPRILYLAKLSFENEGEIKTFPVNQELREFLTTRPACHREFFRLESRTLDSSSKPYEEIKTSGKSRQTGDEKS